MTDRIQPDRSELDSALGAWPVSAADPPHPFDGEWLLSVNGQTYGPYTGHQLKQYSRDGRLDAATPVCRQGSNNWLKAGEDRSLAGLFEAAPPSPYGSSPPPSLSARDGGTVIHVVNSVTAPQPIIFDDFEAGGQKSPVLALVLSVLLVGLGQLYNGQIAKGILMFIGSMVLWAVFLGWTIWIWSILDAYHVSKSINTRRRARMGYIHPH